jgi:HSP20 family protein
MKFEESDPNHPTSIKQKEQVATMSITHFDPLANVRVFEDAFSRFLSEPRNGRPWSPAVDIFETEDELVLKADVPEVDLKDIDVRVENQTLTLSGERKFEKQDSGRGYHRIERSYGQFSRSFSVPVTVDTEKVSAEFTNGVLTVKLPKKAAAKPRQVKIDVKQQ